MSAALPAEHETLRELLVLFDGLKENILKQMGMKWIVEPEPIRRARAILAATAPTPAAVHEDESDAAAD